MPVPKTEVKKKSATDKLPGGGLSRSSTTTPRGFGNDSREPLSRSKSVTGLLSKKEQNEAYFAKMGGVNASRSEGLPPSEGGKYTGFGGGMPVDSSSSRSGGGAGGIPGFDDFQSDPVAALTKGFGWFTTTVGRSAKTVNDTYIQPAAKTVRILPCSFSFSCPLLTDCNFLACGIRSCRPGSSCCYRGRPEPTDRHPYSCRLIPPLCRRK